MGKGREMLSLEEETVKNMNQSGFRHLGGGSGPDGKCTRRGLVTQVDGLGRRRKGGFSREN